jgi:hypothetical protein
MSKVYQPITERGLEIPGSLCQQAQLEGEAVIEVEPGQIRIRAARLSQEEARRLANTYIVMNLGDALYPTDFDWTRSGGEPFWRVTVTHHFSGAKRGELWIHATDGAVEWRPVTR